jgi:hypothetical protein
MSYVITFIVGAILGAIGYALVIRKNPKIQADTVKAAVQAQKVATEVKK